MAGHHTNGKGTLFFALLLLLFLQTLSVWLESIYKIGLTRLSMGPEALALLVIVAPLVLLALPKGAGAGWTRVAVSLFLAGRGVLPWVGVHWGAWIGTCAVGAFLVALCFLLTGPCHGLRGEPGYALGLALLSSMALRNWGATTDPTLNAGPWGIAGLLMIGWAMVRLWRWRPSGHGDQAKEARHPSHVGAPLLCFWASLTVGFLVLASPGVVEAWLGFDNTSGTILAATALAGALILLGAGSELSAGWLAAWNAAFGAALVGGLLALRVAFPVTSMAAAVTVQPENAAGRALMWLMFSLAPVVLWNTRAAGRELANRNQSRDLVWSMILGAGFFVAVNLTAIFANVWGYVGSLSAIFRNEFHMPYLFTVVCLTGAVWLGGFVRVRPASSGTGKSRNRLALALALIAAAGAWHFRPERVGAIPHKGGTLTVLTYNMQQGAALNGDRNWERQLALLRAIDADIVGLQESDTSRPSNGNVNAPKFFAARLGYHVYYGPNTVSGTYGTAVLSRLPYTHPRTFFTYSTEDEVGTAAVEFELDGQPVLFMNSHPSGTAPRICQAEELVRRCGDYAQVIAVGDFNSRRGDEPYQWITGRLQDAWLKLYPDGVGRLHPALRPGHAIRLHGSSERVEGDQLVMPERIDHIFVSKSFNVREAYYLPSPDSETDHPAHWAVLEWEGSARR